MNNGSTRRNTLCRSAQATLIVLFAMTSWPACSVDFDAADPNNQFSCQSDDDCLEGFMCVIEADEDLGVCDTTSVDSEGCQDDDGDRYMGGSDCPAANQPDCDDDDPSISPDENEVCDGVDNDCDPETTEDNLTTTCPLQSGVCTGATQTCVNGSFSGCDYGPDYEAVPEEEESCDGLNNNCSSNQTIDPDDPLAVEDEHCQCIPGVSAPESCQEDLGVCERGLQFCREDGTFSDCVMAEATSENCVDDTECAEGSVCVDDYLDPRESPSDACVIESDDSCTVRTCRALQGTVACAEDAECGPDELCLESFCQERAYSGSGGPEDCNGEDDNCNGRVDDQGACPVCPFNMAFIQGVSGRPNGLCIDLYEASRNDATANDAGEVGNAYAYATSRPAVMPWTALATAQEADHACEASAYRDAVGVYAVPEKFLCTSTDLEAACGGTYPYGDTFEAGSCNDATEADAVHATGDTPDCCTNEGVCDLSGNSAERVLTVWESIFGGSGEDTDQGVLSCDPAAMPDNVEDITTSPEFIGFRCCANATDE